MRILISCEESQTVCKAFRSKGHDAYSCDILPCSGGHPEWHLQKDVREELPYSTLKTVQIQGKLDPRRWDLVISFQPCTDLAVSGSKWFDKKRLSGEQEESINFFFDVWFYSHCSENPVGIMNGGKYMKKWFPKTYTRLMENNFQFKDYQIIHPWQFGHKASKKTCLWLNDLPRLIPTNIVGPPPPYSKMTKSELKEWTAIHREPPGPNRAIIRSKTYQGIADAMADQWSNAKPSFKHNTLF